MESKLRTTPGYNPFYAYVNGKRYFIDKIHFYKTDGTLYSNYCGWFDTNNRIDELIIPEVIKRNKVKFDGVTFIITRKDTSYRGTTDLSNRSEIYIPFEYFDFEVETVTNNGGFHKSYYRKYISRKNNMVWFIDYNETRKQDVIDLVLQKRGEMLFTAINTLENTLTYLKKELKKIDPNNEIPNQKGIVDERILKHIENSITRNINEVFDEIYLDNVAKL